LGSQAERIFGRADKYLEINLIVHSNPNVSNAILYVLLAPDEHGWEKADDLRILATELIEKAGLASHLPAGAWPADNPGLRIVDQGIGDIISDGKDITVEDDRRAWIWTQ
jgi:hypothetical protein